MGRFTYYPPDEIIKQLQKMDRLEEIAPRMLNEAADPLVESMKANIENVIDHKDKSSGELVKSIKKAKAKFSNTKGNYFIQVRPTGTDSRRKSGGYKSKKTGVREPIRNVEKAAYKEFGTSKEAAKPWLRKSLNDAEPAVLDKMQEVFNQEVSG